MVATGNQVAAAGQIAMATDSRGHQHVVVQRRAATPQHTDQRA